MMSLWFPHGGVSDSPLLATLPQYLGVIPLAEGVLLEEIS